MLIYPSFQLICKLNPIVFYLYISIVCCSPRGVKSKLQRVSSSFCTPLTVRLLPGGLRVLRSFESRLHDCLRSNYCIIVEAMGSSLARNIALGVAVFGVLAFIFGVIAENKKPAQGTPLPMKGYVRCKFPNDPTIALGSLSVVSLLISAAIGLGSIFFPYNGQSVPRSAIFYGMTLRVFFLVAVLVSVFAEAMMIWATITEGLHRSRNRHEDMDYKCPTAKTGLFGGAAFLALDASLFWLVCLMLTLNARADYLEDDPKGAYGEVRTTGGVANGARHP